MALKKVKGNIERMFDKNLTDLVRGIRNNKENEAKYISECMEGIKQELRQDNLSVKSNAIAKLTYKLLVRKEVKRLLVDGVYYSVQEYFDDIFVS